MGIERPGLLLPSTVLIAFVASASTELAADEGSWLYRNGWTYWLLLVAGGDLAVVLLLNSMLARGVGLALRAAAGALLLSAVLVAGVLGLWMPYALGLGDRKLDEFSEHSEMSWGRLLALLLASVIVLGTVLGGLTGLLSGRLRPQGRSA